MPRRESSASKKSNRQPSLLDAERFRPRATPSPHPPPKKDDDLRMMEMKKKTKTVCKGNRIASLKEQDPHRPKAPTPIPDLEMADGNARRRSKSRAAGHQSSVSKAPTYQPKPNIEARPPTALRPSDMPHRPQRKLTVEVPKIDLGQAAFEAMTEEDLANLNMNPRNSDDDDDDDVPANRIHDVYAHAQGARPYENDRSRRFGIRYLEKSCFDGVGLHLPDIKENNFVGKQRSRPKPAKPTVVTLDWLEENEPRPDIKLPELVQEPMVVMANRHVPIPPSRPPRPPPKPATSEHPPTFTRQRKVIQQSSRESLATYDEKAPTRTKEKVQTKCWVSPDDDFTVDGSSGQPTYTAVENFSKTRTTPTPQSRNQYYAPRPPSGTATHMAAYGPTTTVPRSRLKESRDSSYKTKPNAVTYHTERLTDDVQVQKDGTMVIGLDGVHVSPEGFSPSPNGVAVESHQKKPVVLPQPKKLSIADQITTYKNSQYPEVREAKARSLEKEMYATLTKMEQDDMKGRTMEDEENRKFREQLLYKDMINKPKPPYHLGTHYAVGTLNVELTPGDEFSAQPEPPKQPPSRLRKRRQPRARKDS